jgi:hypothetical protein
MRKYSREKNAKAQEKCILIFKDTLLINNLGFFTFNNTSFNKTSIYKGETIKLSFI